MKITSHLIALVALLSGSTVTAATFTVMNADESGPGSLRDALTQANSNGQEDTINFDAAFFSSPRTITLTSGELPIGRDGTVTPGRRLEINGPGADLLTISGNKASRVFFVGTRGNAVIRGLTIRDGISVGAESFTTGDGGGFYAFDADVTLSNVTVRNNSATSEGGGVYLNSVRSFTMADSIVTENQSSNNAGGISAQSFGSPATPITFRNSIISANSSDNQIGGLGIARGVTTIENCLITGNQSGLAAGGTNHIGGLALFQTTATITDTSISNNTAGVSPQNGGSIGGVSADGGNMTFRRVTVSGNTAYGNSGGMHLRSGGSTMSVIDSTISNNETINPVLLSFTLGGGLHVEAATSADINVINTTIANNKAGSGYGGGIAAGGGRLNVLNSTITANTAEALNPSNNADGGGGIFDIALLTAATNSQLRLQNSIVAGNSGPGGPDVSGTFISSGYNIIGNTANSTGFGAQGDQLNVDPLLSAAGLQNNGGATLTVALQPNSPAIDAGKAAEATTDQRGVARPTDNPGTVNAEGGDGSDIGAFEIGAANGVAEKTLGNIATRLQVETGENVLIGGIIVVGDVPKRVIIRALGPSLGAAGVAGTLDNPTLELFQGDTLLAANDDWKNDAESEIAETGVQPGDDREAAIVRTLEPGNYTAVLRGKGDTTGIGLVEAYDLDQRPDSKLGNISTRGFVGTGANVLIGGFIVGPTTKVVVRAIGPSLGNAGLAGALQDPALDLVNANGEVVGTNDNWKGTQRAELEAIGIQPSDDREAALIATLTAGNYTAVVRSAANATGVGLVEVYNLP